jgi:hypothetical protein
LALENVWRENPATKAEYPLPDGGKLIGLEGEHNFVSSHALMLERHLPELLPHGALVSIPRRDSVFLHVIEDRTVDEAFAKMAQVAHLMYADGPGPVTPTLHWWQAGKLTPLPCELTPDNIHFTPPDDFAAVLQRL